MLDPGSISTAPMPFAFIRPCARDSRRARSAASIGTAPVVMSRKADRSGSAARNSPGRTRSGRAAAAISARRDIRVCMTAMIEFLT